MGLITLKFRRSVVAPAHEIVGVDYGKNENKVFLFIGVPKAGEAPMLIDVNNNDVLVFDMHEVRKYIVESVEDLFYAMMSILKRAWWEGKVVIHEYIATDNSFKFIIEHKFSSMFNSICPTLVTCISVPSYSNSSYSPYGEIGDRNAVAFNNIALRASLPYSNVVPFAYVRARHVEVKNAFKGRLISFLDEIARMPFHELISVGKDNKKAIEGSYALIKLNKSLVERYKDIVDALVPSYVVDEEYYYVSHSYVAWLRKLAQDSLNVNVHD